MWGQAPMRPLAAENWQAICGCQDTFLSNIVLLTAQYCSTGQRKEQMQKNDFGSWNHLSENTVLPCQLAHGGRRSSEINCSVLYFRYVDFQLLDLLWAHQPEHVFAGQPFGL